MANDTPPHSTSGFQASIFVSPNEDGDDGDTDCRCSLMRKMINSGMKKAVRVIMSFTSSQPAARATIRPSILSRGTTGLACRGRECIRPKLDMAWLGLAWLGLT